MVTWSYLWFPFALVQTSTSMEWSLTTSSTSKTTCVSLFAASITELFFGCWWSVSLWTHQCCYVATMHSSSQSSSIVLRHGVTCWMSSAASRAPGVFGGKAMPWSEDRSCRCFIDVLLLDFVRCPRLIWTRITVCSVRFHIVLPEFDILELRPQLIHFSLTYQCEDRLKLQGIACRTRFVRGMVFPSLCLTLERCIGLKVQAAVGCFLRCDFSVFRGTGAYGVAKQFINTFVFPHLRARAAGFNDNNNNYYYYKNSKKKIMRYCVFKKLQRYNIIACSFKIFYFNDFNAYLIPFLFYTRMRISNIVKRCYGQLNSTLNGCAAIDYILFPNSTLSVITASASRLSIQLMTLVAAATGD